MKNWFACIVCSAFLLGLMPSLTLAQPSGRIPPPQEQKQQQRPMLNKETRKMEELKFRNEDIKEMLETMCIWKMTKALELTEEQCFKIFPKINQIEKTREEAKKKREEITLNLENLLKEKNPDQTKISEALNALDKIELEVSAQEDKFREELKTILSPVQQAKFYVFRKNFEKDVKRMISEVKSIPKGSAPAQPQMKEKETPAKKK